MYTFEISPETAEDLARLEELRTRVDSGSMLQRRWYGRLRRELEAGAVAASTSMEGVPVTANDVRRILAGDRPSSVSRSDADLVSGYRDGMSYVLRRADDPAFHWSTELVRTIHDFVLGHSHALRAGIFRDRQVYLVRDGDVVVYEAPDAGEVPRLLEETCRFAEDSGDLEAPVSAAVLHALVAGIHPFSDGNGRTARIVASLAMYRGGFRRPEFTSLEEWWGRHRGDYYAAFECLGASWTPDADITRFVGAHVRAQRLQVEDLLAREHVDGDLWAAVQEIAAERYGALRFADALYDALRERDVTNRYYRAVAGVSVATATNDLTRLRDAGLLQARGAGRTRSYTGTPVLVAEVAKVLGLDLLIDSGAGLAVARKSLVGALWAAAREREREYRLLEDVAEYGRRHAAEEGLTSDEEIARRLAEQRTGAGPQPLAPPSTLL